MYICEIVLKCHPYEEYSTLWKLARNTKSLKNTICCGTLYIDSVYMYVSILLTGTHCGKESIQLTGIKYQHIVPTWSSINSIHAIFRPVIVIVRCCRGIHAYIFRQTCKSYFCYHYISGISFDICRVSTAFDKYESYFISLVLKKIKLQMSESCGVK